MQGFRPLFRADGLPHGVLPLTTGLTCEEVFSALKTALVAALAMDEVPGSARVECWSYLEHDLADAKRECTAYLTLLASLSEEEISAEEKKRREAHAHG